MKTFKHVKADSRTCALLLVSALLLFVSEITLAGEIHDAAKAGDLDRVQKLVVQGADVNAKAVKGETPLMHAALAGQGEVVNYLLQRGADIFARSVYGLTALHAAAYGGHTDVVNLLIAKGSEVNDASNRFKVTPLSMASEENQIETVKLLLRHGADITATNLNGYNVTSEAGYREHWELLRLLLASGAECQDAELVGDWLHKECTNRAGSK